MGSRLRGAVTGMSAVALLVAAHDAPASERHLTLTYESAVLPPGERELELWITPRWGRQDFFVEYDHRAEFEVGVSDRLQTSLYLNFSLASEGGTATSDLGFSNEWKYKLLDPVADPIGLAIYGELLASVREVELEAKLILDKRIGPVLLAFNLVGEHDWELLAGATQREVKLEGDLGFSYFVTHRFGVGLELQSQSLFSADRGFESSTLLGGPVFSYTARGWWVAASFTPQLGAFKSPAFAAENPGPLELHDHQRYQARLLFSVEL